MKPAIQESSGVAEQVGKVTRPETGSLVTRSDAADWEADGSSGFSYKPLFENAEAGQSTMLMKVDAGALSPPHAHDQLEQVLVLEGEFYDEYGTYGPGDFIVRAPGAVHTGGSNSGALLLLVYSQ